MNKKLIRKMLTASGGPLQLTPEEQKYLEWSKMTPKLQLTYRINRAKAYFNDGQLWNAAKSYFGGFDPRNPHLITGEAPSPGMIKNPKQIILGFLGAKKVVDATKKYITLTKESTKMLNYPKIGKRYSESQDIMSDGWPIGDILHLKIPDGTHSSLGIGNYYRAIGNRKGLKSVIENGVVAPKGQFSREGKVFWNDGYLDRTYSGKGIFALSYDKAGKAKFYSGNKPNRNYVYSSNNTPIDFYDEALGLHARIPFTQTYKEIPKTQEGIDYALKLDKINRYIEKPIHKLYNWGLKPYLGYKGYKYILEEEKTKQHKFKDGGQIQEKQESSKMNILEFLKNGSGIHIKEKNKGKFTSYCGGKVTDECILKGKNSSNPAIRKRATFAANARKWKHKKGGKAFVNGVSILDSNPSAYKYVKKKLKKHLEGGDIIFPNDYSNPNAFGGVFRDVILGRLRDYELQLYKKKLKEQQLIIDAQLELLKTDSISNLLGTAVNMGVNYLSNKFGNKALDKNGTPSTIQPKLTTNTWKPSTSLSTPSLGTGAQGSIPDFSYMLNSNYKV